MARMFPKILDRAVKSSAEKRLYEAFSQELNNNWVVFHNIKWIGTDNRGLPRDGETDFIVAHPDLGVLVIEVKGGRIRFDEKTGHFFSRSTNNKEHDIHDPFEQAMICKKNLLNKLRSFREWPKGRILVGHAVAFPDTVVQKDWQRQNGPKTIIIDAMDLINLEAKLRAIYHEWRGSSESSSPDAPPSTAGIQALINILYQSHGIRNPLLSESIVDDERKLVQLTEKQYGYLQFIRSHTRATISGCAGSGKTFLAVEKARQLAHDEQKRVLFTCYNNGLAQYIGDVLGYRSTFDVFDFHQLCLYWGKQAGLPLPSSDAPASIYFNDLLPNLLFDAIAHLKSQYDAIIVDEGQDFREEWWEALQWLLHDPEQGYMYIFFDDNQRVYRNHNTLPIQAAPFHLDENCRNTQSIARVVTQFYAGYLPTKAFGPEGLPIEILWYQDSRDEKDQLRKLLHRFIHDDGCSHEQIVVLSARGSHSSDILKQRLGPLHLVEHLPLASNEVFATTIRRFKGLEREVVVICEVDGRLSPEDADALLYVGTSRAKHYLAILLGHNVSETIKQQLSPFLSSSR